MPKLFAIAILLIAGNMASLAAMDAPDPKPTHKVASPSQQVFGNPAVDPQKKAWFGQAVEKILEGGATHEAPGSK